MSSRERRAPTIAAALLFLLAGGTLLLQELGGLSVGWGVVLPLLLVVVGVVTVVAGLVDAHRARGSGWTDGAHVGRRADGGSGSSEPVGH